MLIRLRNLTATISHARRFLSTGAAPVGASELVNSRSPSPSSVAAYAASSNPHPDAAAVEARAGFGTASRITDAGAPVTLNAAAATIDTTFPVRNDWTLDEVRAVYAHPLLDLVFHGASAHRTYFSAGEVQRCTLLSVKTGGCPEDCKYCSQSSRYDSDVSAEVQLGVDDVVSRAEEAKAAGSTRFCMGAAWRGPSQVGRRQFGRILDAVSRVRGMGLEVCATLGMLTADQAKMLKDAGLTAYNHNLDTSREFYPSVITSRVFQDRLDTLEVVRDAGISVCCGGIIGLGETHADRASLLHTLATLPQHPESVPVNALVANKGTPLEDQPPVPVWDLVRMIAAARIIMPAAMVRLSAGRVALSPAEQGLCFMAGANSIFTGDKLLTTPNPEFSDDADLFATLGLKGKKPFFYEQPAERRQAVEGRVSAINT